MSGSQVSGISFGIASTLLRNITFFVRRVHKRLNEHLTKVLKEIEKNKAYDVSNHMFTSLQIPKGRKNLTVYKVLGKSAYLSNEFCQYMAMKDN